MKKQLRAADGVGIIVILITLIVCPGLYAAEETLPKAEEIIANNIKAIGGSKALEKIKNKKIDRSIKAFLENKESKSTSYWERISKYLYIWDGGTVGICKSGSDGKIAWWSFPDMVRLLEGDHLSNELIEKSFDGPDGPDVPYISMKTEGVEQINGKDCYKVVKIPEKGTERTVYYDKKSFLIVKTMVYNTEARENYIRETYYEEYQKINNILFPYKIVTYLNGQKVSEYTYDKIELNIEMPESIFDIPEEVKAIMNKK